MSRFPCEFWRAFLFAFVLFLGSGPLQGQDEQAPYYPDRLYVKVADSREHSSVDERIGVLLEELAPQREWVSIKDPIHLRAPSLVGIREIHCKRPIENSTLIEDLQEQE
ncbi:MAG: hypothetical protein ABEH38_06290, partial [Flavobacteriales bacterium]